MSEPEDLSDEAVEALVRDHIDREAGRIDAVPSFDRLRASWPSPVARNDGTACRSWVVRLRPTWSLAWGLSAAAVLLIAATWIFQSRPAMAGAEGLVRAAEQELKAPLDRCYLVEVRRDSDSSSDSASNGEESPLQAPFRLTKLWTRGDRFRVESPDPEKSWAWGRGEDQRVWFALGTHRGVVLEPDEIPRWLSFACDLYAIRVDQILGAVLRDFDLETDTRGDAGSSATRVVRATLKPGRSHPAIRGAVLEIDAATSRVRRMVLDRTIDGQPPATATYTLVETRPRDDDAFRLEGHLVAPYTVSTHDHEPERRRGLLSRWFGRTAAASFPLRERSE